jgi:acetyl-CoA carboxylase biotin carboxyl carrier protein
LQASWLDASKHKQATVDIDKAVLDELIALMQRDHLDRVRIEAGDVMLDVRMSGPAASGERLPDVKRNLEARQAPAAPDQAAPPGVTKMLAPLVGVFYRSPAPGAKPFVEVGDAVVAGQVLCILEAMKLMNEIVSEHTGRIARICVPDGQLVTLHQELFWIET